MILAAANPSTHQLPRSVQTLGVTWGPMPRNGAASEQPVMRSFCGGCSPDFTRLSDWFQISINIQHHHPTPTSSSNLLTYWPIGIWWYLSISIQHPTHITGSVFVKHRGSHGAKAAPLVTSLRLWPGGDVKSSWRYWSEKGLRPMKTGWIYELPSGKLT